MSFWAAVISSAVGSAFLSSLAIIKYCDKFFFLRIRCFFTKKRVRVSCSSIAKIVVSSKDSPECKYVLIKSDNNEHYHPIGGATKCFGTVSETLSEFDFDNSKEKKTPYDHIWFDLRGQIPADELVRFITWYNTNINREAHSIEREYREEIKSLPEFPKGLDEPSFKYLRRVYEDLAPVPGQNYIQFRIFDVFEMVFLSDNGRNALEKLATESDKLAIVTRKEIESLRTEKGNVIIGDHASYFFDKKRIGTNPPAYKK